MKRGEVFEGHHITLNRGQQPLLNSFSFQIERGECLGIQGPNGSGKTSFLRLLGGLLFPGGGFFQWNKQRCDLLSLAHRARVVYAGVLSDFSSHMTLKQQKVVSLALLERWGLDHLLPCPLSFLSQGQKQRFHLASHLDPKRPLWLLDEPVSHLDQEGKAMLRDTLIAHMTRGGLVCVTSHEDFPLDPTQRASFLSPPLPSQRRATEGFGDS